MKILYVSEFFYEVNGANQLSMMHYQTLKKIYGEENIITIALTGNEKIYNNEYYNFQSYSNKFQKVRNLVQFNTIRINNNIIKNICNIIENEKITDVFIDNSIYGKLVKKIKNKNKNIEVATFYHDVKRNLYNQWLKSIGVKFLPEYFCGLYNEYLNQKYADYNITLNKRESNLFEKYYNKGVSFELPIIVKKPHLIDSFNDLSKMKDEKIKILFVGAYYYPNVSGIKWFINNVLFNIDDKYELYIVGRDMEKLREEYNSDRVKVIGSVKNLSEYYSLCDLVIAPIFEGAGMKVKTAEAFSYGKMFIGTEESLEGYIEHIPNNVLNDKIFECNKKEEYIELLNKYTDIKIEKFNIDVHKVYLDFFSEDAALNKLKIF